MNSTELQTILSTVLRQQEQRFTQLMETLRLANGVAIQATPTQTTCSEQRNSHPPQLLDIEAYVADIENPTHLEDWLKRFEMSLLCAAPNISDKEKAMVLATKLSTDAFAELRKCCLPKEVTDYTYEETVTRLRVLFTKERSIFADRYDCVRLARFDGEDFMHLVNRCKAAIKRFRFDVLISEQFSALILLSALKAPTDEPSRARLLCKLNQDGDQVRFDDVITDCVSFLTTKADCQVFTNENVLLNAVQRPPHERRQYCKLAPAQQSRSVKQKNKVPHLHASDVATYIGTETAHIGNTTASNAKALVIWKSNVMTFTSTTVAAGALRTKTTRSVSHK